MLKKQKHQAKFPLHRSSALLMQISRRRKTKKANFNSFRNKKEVKPTKYLYESRIKQFLNLN
jgi:hypothetical protein